MSTTFFIFFKIFFTQKTAGKILLFFVSFMSD